MGHNIQCQEHPNQSHHEPGALTSKLLGAYFLLQIPVPDSHHFPCEAIRPPSISFAESQSLVPEYSEALAQKVLMSDVPSMSRHWEDLHSLHAQISEAYCLDCNNVVSNDPSQHVHYNLQEMMLESDCRDLLHKVPKHFWNVPL